jgi:polyisoprenoid-binding protein YceI
MEISIKTLALGAMLLATPWANAQTPPPGPGPNTVASKVEAGSYTVDPMHARLLFAVSHMGFTTWYGEFTHITGTLTLDPKDIAKTALDVTIAATSVSTSNATLDHELNSPQWFDTAKYPTITFKSTKIVRTGKDTADVDGKLTFHGVTLPETLRASFNGSGVNFISKQYTAGFNATAEIKRSAFGVKTYVPMIGDAVSLMISVPFVK